MAFQDLLEVLGEGGAGEHHVAAGLMGLLLQLALDVRKVTNYADVFQFGAALEFCNDFERIHAFEIQIEDDQSGMSFGFYQDFVLVLDEFHRQTGALGGVVDLHGKEQITDNRKNFLVTLPMHRVQLQRFSL